MGEWQTNLPYVRSKYLTGEPGVLKADCFFLTLLKAGAGTSKPNKSAKRTVKSYLNFILFADPRGAWIPVSLGTKAPVGD